ncbi:MAG: hypothetical protein ABIY52_19200 [Gemmatimonadaceae bacterium]
MGSEARTTLTLGRQQFAGTAHLDSDELQFRGEAKLRIPLRSVVMGQAPAGAPTVLYRVVKATQPRELVARRKAIAPNGAIWVVHPRGVASVADTVVFAAATDAGLTCTKACRFSDTDTAEKLVIPSAAR